MESEIELEELDQCRSCMGDHDEHVHAATLRVRGWLGSEVNRKLSYAAEVETVAAAVAQAA